MGKKKGRSSRDDRKGKRINPLENNQRLKKDPGLPNLNSIKAKMEKKVKNEKERQRNARERLQNRNRVFNTSNLTEMVQKATERGREFEESQIKVDSFEGTYAGEGAVTGQKDNSRKAYFKEFKKVLDNADVILEVLDARDPLGCRTKKIEQDILESGINKKIILILNKIDLVPKDVVEDWLKYLRNEYPTIAFKASTQNQRSHLGQINISTDIATDNMLNSSECLGADTLIKLLKNYCRNSNIKTSITVGVIGFPNVGKSSVINSLKRSKVCGVGSTPGVTKNAQQIHLDKNIKLLDCPGIVFTQARKDGKDAAEVLLRNCVKVELLEDPITPVELIVSRCKPEQLMELYGVDNFETSYEFLLKLAAFKGKLKKGGVPDIESTAKSVIQDWNTGKIPYYTIPPKRKDIHVSTAIVTNYSKEFELPEIVNVEGSNNIDSMMSDEKMNDTNILIQENANKDVMDEDNSDNDTNIPEIRINFKKKEKSGNNIINGKEKPANQMINPQANKDIKKMMKKIKKDERKMEKNTINEDNIQVEMQNNNNNTSNINISELTGWGMSMGGGLPIDEDIEL